MLWLRREEGQDLTEYALLIGLIVIICILAITLLGTSISQVLSGIASALQSALGGLGWLQSLSADPERNPYNEGAEHQG
jgi:Flp pilus assembly pilin Flp